MADVNYKPEGSVSGSVSQLLSGVWDEIRAIPGNIGTQFKDHTGTAILESFLPPLLLVDSEVRAYNNKNADLSSSENAVKGMIEDSILKGNNSQLKDALIMHSGDPHSLDRIMTQAQQDLGQFGVTMNWDGDKGTLNLQTNRAYFNVDTTGTETFGSISNGKHTAAGSGQTADQFISNISSSAQSYTQQRFQH